MLSIIFYASLAALAGLLIRNYKDTGSTRSLAYAGDLVLVIAFFATMGAGADAVLYGGDWRIFAAAAPLTLLAFLMIAPAWGGWSSLVPLALASGFFVFTTVIAFCLTGYRGMIIKHHATGECRKVVAECSSGILPRLPAPKKQEAVKKMTDALAATSDHYTRIGLIYNLYYVPAEAQAALPAVIPLIAEADPDTLEYILKLLSKMGTGAADAAPAVAARIANHGPRESTYELEGALKKITPQQNLTGHGPVLSGS